ncbi:bromodomain-containing protein 8-like isoform X3, partial [Leptotrombidium deliense]
EEKRNSQKIEETHPVSNVEVTIIPIVIDTTKPEESDTQKEPKVIQQQTAPELPGVQITPIEEPIKSPTKDVEMEVLKDIKQEVVESKEEEHNFEEVSVKQEVEESDDSTPAITDLKTPGVTPILVRSKRRKPPVPAISTPVATPTRRSGRVKANRELKLSESDERENAPNLESGAKKFTVTDEITDASMSEESLDAAVKQTTSKAPSITESTPNSPASSTMHSEDAENLREYKQWKKSIMLLWRQAATHKYASLFLHPVTDDEAKGYSTVVYRPQDLTTIRKKIENSTLRTTAEFQRDIMLMFQNAIMYNSADHEVHQMAVEMQKEILEGIEDFIETQQQGNQTAELTKSRVRRSGLSTPITETHEQENSIAFRRKSRTSTDTDPGSSSTAAKAKTKKKP